MFSDFKAAFKDKPSYEINVPDGILKAISAPLPDGFKYVNVENGFCRIETEGEFNVSSQNIQLPQQAKEVLGATASMDEVWTYLYNSQRQAVLIPDKDGFYTINGQIINANDLVIAPFANDAVQIVKDSTRMFLMPPPFPRPHQFEIGSKNCKKKVKIKRIPNDSLNVSKYCLVDEGALKFKYEIDSITNKFTYNIGVCEADAESIEEIVIANEIYNAFVLGEGYIGEMKVSLDDDYSVSAKSKEVIDFWKKVLEIERLLNAKFVVDKELKAGAVDAVTILHNCLINKIPYKKYENYENVSGTGLCEKNKPDLDMVGKEVYFEMVAESSITLFGVKISLYQIIGIFNAVVANYILPLEASKDKFCIELKAKEGEKMYTGNMLFLSEKELEEYRKEKEHIDLLRDAEEYAILELIDQDNDAMK